jgi:hypothetical protein
MNSYAEYPSKRNNNNVIVHRPQDDRQRQPNERDKLTAQLVLDQHERGELPRALLEFLLVGVGLLA